MVSVPADDLMQSHAESFQTKSDWSGENTVSVHHDHAQVIGNKSHIRETEDVRIEYNKATWTKNVALSETGCYNYKRFTNIPSMKFRERRRLKPKRKLQQLNCTKRFPQVLMIGIKKCGTQSLSTFLDLHPQLETVVMPVRSNSFNKERFSIETFLKQMPLSTPNQVTLVSHPGLINTPEFAQYLLGDSISPDLKFIIILRDPTNRAISDFVHVQNRIDHFSQKQQNAGSTKTFKKYQVKESFEETVIDNQGNVLKESHFIERGIYIDLLRNFLQEIISLDRILVIDGDRMKGNPVFALKQVEKFLGLSDFFKKEHFYFNSEKGFHCAQVKSRPDLDCMPSTKGRSHPLLDESFLQKLRDFFKPYNRQLQVFLNQTLSFMES